MLFLIIESNVLWCVFSVSQTIRWCTSHTRLSFLGGPVLFLPIGYHHLMGAEDQWLFLGRNELNRQLLDCLLCHCGWISNPTSSTSLYSGLHLPVAECSRYPHRRFISPCSFSWVSWESQLSSARAWFRFQPDDLPKLRRCDKKDVGAARTVRRR